jgi:hypothetical protein
MNEALDDTMSSGLDELYSCSCYDHQNRSRAGEGPGVEYATSMDPFAVGVDALARYLIGPSIPTIAIFPRVKYTF